MMNDHDQLEALRRAQEAEDRVPLKYGGHEAREEGVLSDEDNPIIDAEDEELDRETAERFRGLALEGLETRISELEEDAQKIRDRVYTLEFRMDNVPTMISDLRDEMHAKNQALKPITIHYPVKTEPDLVAHRKAVEALDRYHQADFKGAEERAMKGMYPRPMGPAQLEEAVRLRGVAAEKDAKIETLRSKLQVAEAIIESKEVRLRNAGDRISVLAEDVTSRSRRNTDLMKEIREQEDRIAELEKELSEKKTSLSVAMADIDGVTDEKERWKEDALRLKMENEGRKISINRLRRIIEEQGIMIKELKGIP